MPVLVAIGKVLDLNNIIIYFIVEEFINYCRISYNVILIILIVIPILP